VQGWDRVWRECWTASPHLGHRMTKTFFQFSSTWSDGWKMDLTLVMSLSKSVAIVSLMALKWTLWNSFCDESDRFFIVWIFKCDFCDAWDIWDITMYVVRCSLWMRQLNHFSEATYMKMWHLSIIRFFRENIQICINGSLFLHHDNTTCHVLYFKYMW